MEQSPGVAFWCGFSVGFNMNQFRKNLKCSAQWHRLAGAGPAWVSSAFRWQPLPGPHLRSKMKGQAHKQDAAVWGAQARGRAGMQQRPEGEQLGLGTGVSSGVTGSH